MLHIIYLCSNLKSKSKKNKKIHYCTDTWTNLLKCSNQVIVRGYLLPVVPGTLSQPWPQQVPSPARTPGAGSLQTPPRAYAPYGWSSVANFPPSGRGLYWQTKASSLLEIDRHPSPCRSKDISNVNLRAAGVREWSETAAPSKKKNSQSCSSRERTTGMNLPLPRFVLFPFSHLSPLSSFSFAHLCSFPLRLPLFYFIFFPFSYCLPSSFLWSCCPPPSSCLVLQMAARQRFVWGENRFEWRMETKEGTKRQ